MKRLIASEFGVWDWQGENRMRTKTGRNGTGRGRFYTGARRGKINCGLARLIGRGRIVAMPLNFEWDENKARLNLVKHGINFEEASTVFGDPLSLTVPDPDHSQREERSIIIGISRGRNFLVVVHTERGDNIRIISARRASRQERKSYEEGKR